MTIQVHHIRNGLRKVKRRTVRLTSHRNRFDALTSKDVMALADLSGLLVRSRKRLRVLLLILANKMLTGDDEDSFYLPLLYLNAVKQVEVLKKRIYSISFTSQEYRESHHIGYNNFFDFSARGNEWVRAITGFSNASHFSTFFSMLDLPDYIISESGHKFRSLTAVLCMYKRFISNTSNEDMGREFCIDPNTLEKMVNIIIMILYYKFARKLKSEHALDRYASDLPIFVRKIKEKIANPSAIDAAPYVFDDDFNTFGFIDGCLKRSTRPGSGPAYGGIGSPRRPNAGPDQMAFYTGYKKNHGGKFIQCVGPNGMCLFTTPMFSARRTDQLLYNEHGVDAIIEQHCNAFQNGRRFCTYTDLGFKVTDYNKRAFRITKRMTQAFRDSHDLEPLIADCNAQDIAMNRVRQCSEHKNAMDSNLCKHLDDWKSWKFLSTDSNKNQFKRILVALFLVDVHSCFYGNQISSTFGCATPSIGQYIERLNSID